MDVTDMLSELNDSGFTDSTNTRKVSMLNDALWDAAARQPWPFLETSLVLTFNGSSPVPTNMPADFRAALGMVDTSNQNAKLEYSRYDDLDSSGVDFTTTGTAQVYYIFGGQINVWPIPGASATVRLRYIRKPAAMTESTVEADIDWPVEHHRVIVLGGLYKLYDLEDDPELATRFQGHFENRINQMIGEVFQQQYDRQEVIGIDTWFDIDME